MSALLQVQEQLLSTGALIERIERAAVSHAATPATLSNLRSLVRQRDRLQQEFEEIAHRQEMDVYHYRLLPMATERITLAGVADSWKSFQTFFSVVYDAVKNGPQTTAKLGMAETLETAFGFGYSYPGSLGVVLTLPNERLLLGETYLGLATLEAFKLAQAETSEQIAASARRLGPPAIRALYNWAESHVEHGLGAAIEWRRDHETSASVLVQYPELDRLRKAIILTSDTTEAIIRVEGLLQGADVRAKTFSMSLPNEPPIQGKFTDAISEAQTVELPRRYIFVIRRTTKMQLAYDKEQTTYFLVSLSPL